MTTFLVPLLRLGFDFIKRAPAALYRRLAGVPVLYFGLVKLVVVLAALLWLPPTPSTVQAAVVAGFSEFYLAGSTDQLFALLRDNDNDPQMGNANVLGLTVGNCNIGNCNRMHSVATVVIATDNTKVYYDHWENGYGTGTTGNDEVYTGNAGDVLVFESANIVVPRTIGGTCASTNPGGAATVCYDGRDRIYSAGGAIGVAQAFWPEVNGTVYANAWEIYPVKPYQSTYVLPVGEDLFAAPRNYADFKHVYVLAQATEDGTVVTIDDPVVPGVQVNVTLSRGETTQYFHANTGTTITGSKPIQVQFIAGQDWINTSSDTRSYTAVPGSLWDTAYYAPVPSANTTTEIDIYIYNPTASNLVINYEDRLGAGTITIPPNSTRSYSELVGREVPTTSAVALAAADGTTRFWAIGSNDTENADYNHGFSLIPASTLTNDYYIGWAPGTTTLVNNGSPVFVTATQDNTTIFVDYSPTNGVVDATYTLDRIQVQKIFDPDNNNTGMHIWATAPIALVWGEDATVSDASNPYIDAGYAILPLKPEWVDIVVTLDKSANPSSISPVAGQVSEFTLSFNAEAYGLDDVYVTDVLPANWAYIPGTTLITWPGGSSTTDPAGGTGPNLSWGSAVSPLANLQPNEILTLVYQAQTTGVPGDYSINTATGTGTYNGETFSASDTTTVAATPPDLTVTKTNDVVGNALVDHPFVWTLEVLNGSGSGLATFASGQVILRDNLPTGPSYGAVTVTPGTPAPGGTGSISCSIAANTLTCTASGGTVTLPTGASFQVAFSVTPASAGTLVNPPAGGGSVCQVDPNGVVAESDETNNTASDTVTVVAPTLAITKISSTGGAVNPGDTIAYTLSIANTGSSQQNNIVVMDILPAGTTYVPQSTSAISPDSVTSTYRDQFGVAAYNNSNGAAAWGSTPWTESGADAGGNPAGGTTLITGGWLRYSGAAAVSSLTRPVNLANAINATLTFDHFINGTIETGDLFVVEISSDGGANWTSLGSFDGTLTNGSKSYDISAYANANTQIRFSATGFTGGSSPTDERLELDNVQIQFGTPNGIITKDNIPGGVNADLASGTPATLIVAVDNFDLAVGDTMSVTYQVTVNDPVPTGQTSVVNTAQASSDEQPQPVSATVTDTIGAPALATIGDQVWNDTNGNGVQDGGETGISGVTVTLYLGATPVQTVTTNASGLYTFTNVLSGTYSVQFSQSSGYTFTGQDQGGNDNLDSDADPSGQTAAFVVNAGDVITNIDAGLYEPASISGQVREDTDADGNLADPDSGITGATVVLYSDPNGDGDPADGVPVLTTTTTITGGYLFTDVTPGSYVVVETDPSGYSSTADTDAPNDNQISVTLTGGTDSIGNDFLDTQPATVSGQVREDTDGDGNLADPDSGITGVTVVLYTDPNGDGDPADGVPVLTTTTTITGSYVFTNITPGSYIVVETDPNGYSSTADTDVPNDNQIEVTLTSGQTSSNNDFLDSQPATISGQVREDTDGDGDLTDPDSGITSVTVVLYTDPNGDGDPVDGVPVLTTTTTITGGYVFTNVTPGNYVVIETDPNGYDSTADTDAPNDNQVSVTLTSGTDSTGNDFLDTQPATVSGQIREDTDGDGNLADPDSGITGVTVVLYTDPNGDGNPADGTPVLTTTTTITGGYVFTNITPGNYVVVETDPNGYSSTADTDAPNDNQIEVTLTSGQTSNGNDFLDSQPASISGQVRDDIDSDGDLADPDNGITGVTVALYTDPNGDGDPADGVPVLTTTTTITGGYIFTNVNPGSYVVVETDPSGYSSTADTDAPNDNQVSVTLTSGTDSTGNDFLDTQPAIISGQVRDDTDGDGNLADPDSGITGVTVVLYTDPNGDGDPTDGVPVLTTTTTITGGYVFTNVTPGNYVVVETDPSGYSSTADTDAPNDNQISVTLTGGTNSTGHDFLDTQPATVSGQVREDTDGDGSLADPDSGITSVTVVLYTDPNGDGDPVDGMPVLTTTTTVTGGYVFTNVTPGNYVVIETDPSGYSSTADTNAPNDNQIEVTLTSGTDSTGNDFLDTQPATISGQVREDTDSDGDLADPDSGITGVTVVLYTDPNGDGNPADGVPVLTTTTTITGGYVFTNVTPGSYIVVETDPNGYSSTADTDAPNDNQIEVTLTSGTNSAGNDFLDTQPGTVSGQVREDTDGDGDLTDPDSGITGVTVVLYTDPDGDGNPADGVPVLTTTTTITGGYVFTNVTPGSYIVVETDPNGYNSTADTDAPNDNQIEVTLTSGQTSNSNDFLDSQPADVTLIKQDSPDPVVAGGVLTYTLVYTNNGPATADNVLITDTLPAQVAFGGVVSQPGTVSGPAGAGQTRVWTVGKLAPGASGTIVFTVTVSSNTSFAITNNAVISTTTPDNNPSNNSDNEPTTVINPDIAIAKTPDNQQVINGGTVTFTIRVTNTGNVTLNNVTVSDPLAPACTNTLGTLAPRASTSYTCTLSNVTVDFTNVATATGTPPVGSNVSDNDDANVDVISNPGLEVEKSVDLAEVAPNQIVTYTIAVTNTGNVLIRPVRVTDTLPAGFSYVPGSGSPLPNSINGGRLIWNDVTGGAGLTPGQSLRVTFRAIMPATPSTYINTAVVAGTHPTGVITDTDTAPVVVADPTVEIVKTALAPGVVDGLITFTIRITNTGPSTLDEVPLVDHFTGPVVYVGGTPPANTVDNVHQVIGWNDLTANTPNGFGRDLAPQESFVITTVFSLTTGATTFTMTNVATVNNAIDIFNNPVNEDADAEVITNEPTAIQLLYFKGERQGNSVSLTWATAVELDNFGFRILRSASGSLADAVDLAFIPGRGHGTASGASYSFSDKTAATNQTYSYWLVDVDFNGLETFHGPVTAGNPGVDRDTSSTIFLPVIVQ